MRRTDPGVHGGKPPTLFALAALIVCLALFLLPRSTLATWSIAAVDKGSGEVGVAGASCALDVWRTGGVAPGRGVVVAQARISETARDRGVGMLMEGAGPGEVLAVLTDPAFDSSFRTRQYGVVVLGGNGGAAAFTGAETEGVSTDVQDRDVTVQGNCLASAEVVEATLAAFRKVTAEKDLSLPDRLLAALEAGSRAGGDIRCREKRALSAFIVVARPADKRGSPYVSLRVRSSGEPVPLLRQRYEAWKKNTARATGTVAEILETPEGFLAPLSCRAVSGNTSVPPPP